MPQFDKIGQIDIVRVSKDTSCLPLFVLPGLALFSLIALLA